MTNVIVETEVDVGEVKKEKHNCFANIAASWQGDHVVRIFCVECGAHTDVVCINEHTLSGAGRGRERKQ